MLRTVLVNLAVKYSIVENPIYGRIIRRVNKLFHLPLLSERLQSGKTVLKKQVRFSQSLENHLIGVIF